MKLRNQTMKYNLQFFAEPGAGADGGNGDGQGEGTDNGNGDGNQPASFDDFLKDGKNQSEFDKRVAKAIETRQAKWQAKWQAEYEQKIEDAKTEAAKLAKMTADQKAQYEQEQRTTDLEKREKEITVRELKAQANVSLTEKGLPMDLAEILNYADAESCNKSIEAVEKAFQTAVEKAVNDKLRGTGAPKGTGNNQSSVDTDKMSDAEFYAYMAQKKKG